VRKKISRKVGAFLIPPLLFVIMKLLWLTYRKNYHFIDELIEGQCMAVTWHAELLVAPQVYRKFRKHQKTSAIIAQHYDGELIARTFSFLQIAPLRGSSRRGAKAVLIAAIKALKGGDSVMVTPDGPKGPRYSMSDGAVSLALRSHLPLMVVNYNPSSYWKLKSWDQFIIPRPFSTLEIYHQVIHIDGMEREEAKQYLKKQMLKYSLS
jgi:lysophospholipid acyltransferase (LPLAT)-like uncharacterized protein